MQQLVKQPAFSQLLMTILRTRDRTCLIHSSLSCFRVLLHSNLFRAVINITSSILGLRYLTSLDMFFTGVVVSSYLSTTRAWSSLLYL